MQNRLSKMDMYFDEYRGDNQIIDSFDYYEIDLVPQFRYNIVEK